MSSNKEENLNDKEVHAQAENDAGSSSEEEEVDTETDSDSDSSSDEKEGDRRHPDAYTGNEEVQVEFEGRAPIDSDCHGISQLLSRLFLKAPINHKEMADLIIGQNFVGSVIGQVIDDDDEDDDDICEDDTVFGITTAVNVTAKKDKPCIEQLRSYILQRAEKHASEDVLTRLRDVLGNDSKQVGFLINERFINIPPQISVPLFDNLKQELETATQKGMKYQFDYYLMMVKFYRKEARKRKPAKDFYSNAEEEVISKGAEASFEYSVADETDSGLSGDWMEDDVTLTPYRKVILFNAMSFPQVTKSIKEFLQGDLA